MFKFIHAADIHLDSPLKGLERYDGAPVDQIREATRQALDNLVQLAITEEVAFVLIAGDLYDDDWKDYNTGLFFIGQMAELRNAGIPVVLLMGNHDAANKMTKVLRMPDNVRTLSHRKPDTIELQDYGVAIHGQSFAKAAVTDDLSAGYPTPRSGFFNVGMLHTCATGREGHEKYAPCTIDGLLSKRYDYWALGHVHKQEILREDPPIVFPGNLQGRHIRETGPKGCVIVTVDDSNAVSVQRHYLDAVRWEMCSIDATDAANREEALDRLGDVLNQLVQRNEGRLLAVRVQVSGACPAHDKIASQPERWLNEVRNAALQVGEAIWIEKVISRTSRPRGPDGEPTDGPLGEITEMIKELRSDEKRLTPLSGELEELKRRLPPELREGPDAIRLDDPQWLRQVLAEVQPMLVSRLLENGGLQ